ncbi:MarR family transcriptional regulator [Acidiferrimicrobium sp. IK]|uniref:MarR family transcriptional regulator n=1 Tax=Acidiferrimicrobium sp. IK TaxID=2871700 RepID=UPI002915F418|nr:MarR family transcriptional regulator [Acidiferrimicrobium sp. IK]MCU4184304.1 MarR family transcriptional regulator [Acidiferrimicrobium sp. IK]
MSRSDETARPESSPKSGPHLAAPGEEALGSALARLGLEGTLLLHALAERMGMAATDLSCLLLLVLEGPATAGRLATRSGLTSGAITGVVDRLARVGLVERRSDPDDRRRVVISLVEPRWPQVRQAMTPLSGAVSDLALALQGIRNGAEPPPAPAPGDTTAPVAALRVLQLAGDAFASAVEQLRRPLETAGPAPAPPHSNAVLRLTAWSSGTVVVRAGDLGADLARRVEGPVSVRVRVALVALTQLRGRQAGSGPAVVDVHRDVAWEVDLSGGANRLRVELPDLSVTGINVRGGANRVELALPAPVAPTPVHIGGGANRVQISRPAGVPVRIRVRGGAHDVRVDGIRVDRGWAGDVTPDADADVAPGYDLDISGGASKLVVD